MLPESSAPSTGVASEVRARRAASQRCVPLASGQRDPLDANKSGQRRFAWIKVDERRRLILVSGSPGTGALLRQSGMRPMWSVTGRGYLLDHHRLPDVCAVLEWERYAVRVRSIDLGTGETA